MANLTDAASAALKSGAKKMKVAGHEFNIKPAMRGWVNDKYVIRGRISHCLSLRPDDQFDYTVSVGLYPPNFTASANVDLGGFAAVVGPIAGSALAKLAPFPISLVAEEFNSYVLTNVVHGLEEEISGKGWRHVAQAIVAAIYTLLTPEIRRTAPPPPVGYVPPQVARPDRPERPGPPGSATQ